MGQVSGTGMDESTVLILFAVTVVGLLVGSFLNVVIARVPQGGSVVRPRSRCPGCDSPIAPRDNIPLLSWLLLAGKCRSCLKPIPMVYPLVEAGTGLGWLAVGLWAVGDPERWWIAPLALAWVSAGIALLVIDIQHHRLPNALVYPMYPITVVGLMLADVGAGQSPWSSVIGGALLWVVPLGLIYVLTRGRGMGLGDVKIAVPLGATLGWFGMPVALVGLIGAFVLGALVGVIALTRSSWAAGNRVRRIAFGPFLLAGAAASAVWGASLWQGYVTFVGLA